MRQISHSLLCAALLIAGWGGVVYASNPFQTGPTRMTNLGNVVHGRDTQFIQFTNGFGVNDVTDVVWPQTIARRVINIIFSLLGIIAVAVIIYAGFLWMSAGGEEEQVKKAHTLLLQASLGLVVILSAYMISYFVIDQLKKAIFT